MLLLFNEPFTPGDMVTFRTGSTEVVGRVERVGWGQTKIRGRDTRSTFVPNSHFVQAAGNGSHSSPTHTLTLTPLR
jgi:small-conductance mechanosensitive channel